MYIQAYAPGRHSTPRGAAAVISNGWLCFKGPVRDWLLSRARTETATATATIHESPDAAPPAGTERGPRRKGPPRGARPGTRPQMGVQNQGGSAAMIMKYSFQTRVSMLIANWAEAEAAPWRAAPAHERTGADTAVQQQKTGAGGHVLHAAPGRRRGRACCLMFAACEASHQGDSWSLFQIGAAKLTGLR